MNPLSNTEFLAQRGYIIGRKLGWGAEGTVWKIANKSGLVVKVTESREEYECFKYLRRLKNYPQFFPRVKDLWVRKSEKHSDYPYIIVREDVKSKYGITDKLLYDFETLSSNICKDRTFISRRKAWFKKVDQWCNYHHIRFFDLHDQNIGIRRGEMVIRDLGMCAKT